MRSLFIVVLTLFWGITAQSFAQQNRCEDLMSESIATISQLLERNDFVRLDSVLQMMQERCSDNEVLQRVGILSMIIQKKPSEKAITSYITNAYDELLIKRLDDAAHSDYTSIYTRNRAVFGYVPLRHAIDSLVHVKSVALLNTSTYHLSATETSMLLLYTDHVDAYLTRTGKKKPVSVADRLNDIERRKDRFSFVLSGGVYTPMNAVNPIFRTSPIFGVGLLSALSRDWVFDGFFKVRPNTDSRPFQYDHGGSTQTVRSNASYLMGASAGYKVLDGGDYLLLGKLGLAFEAATTELSGTTYWGHSPNSGIYSYSKWNTVNTYNLSAGVSAMKLLFGGTFIGVQVHYHYSPYNNYDRLVTPIASDYVSAELFLRF